MITKNRIKTVLTLAAVNFGGNVMKKLILLLVLVFVASSSAVTVITTPEELQAMGDDLAGDYILGNDIDLTGLTWEAISWRLDGVDTSFTGTFDGDFHVIKNFTGIDDDLNDNLFKNASLFGVLGVGGVVKNVGMTDVNVTAEDYVAALVGDLKGELSKCWVESGTVTMVGGNNGGTVVGLIRAGGIVTDCYSTADLVMTGPFTAGGFAQGAWGTVDNCYFAGTLTSADGTTLIGGFVRTNAGAATSCYYDKDVAGPDATDGATQARTTAEMMTQANFVGWDFENTWFIDEGQTYPTLVPIVVDPTFPTVDAGEDMLTWSGEPVKLDPNVVNNDPCEPQAPLTYLWSADPAAGVVFGPNAYIEAPMVTITKPALILTSISIDNAGFETPVLADGAATSTPPAWTDGYYNVAEPGVWVVGDAEAGAYNPVAGADYNGVAPEGKNVMYATSGVGFDRGMSQVLSAKLEANTQYILSALVGNPFLFNGSTAAGNYRIELLAGGVLLKSDTGASPANDKTWKTASLTYDSGAGPVQLGQALAIRLVAVNFTNGKGVDFDDVKLTAEGPAPVPYVVTLTLAVNNEGSTRPDVKDTMTIDVYDDACQMARLGEGKAADNSGDFDGDCITDGNDLAELAAQWLTGDALTVPIIKP